MMRDILLNLAACLAVALLISVAVAIGLSRLPDAIVYQSYPDKQCLAVDIVQDNEWHRIKCHEFDWTRDYATEWGGDELELLH